MSEKVLTKEEIRTILFDNQDQAPVEPDRVEGLAASHEALRSALAALQQQNERLRKDRDEAVKALNEPCGESGADCIVVVMLQRERDDLQRRLDNAERLRTEAAALIHDRTAERDAALEEARRTRLDVRSCCIKRDEMESERDAALSRATARAAALGQLCSVVENTAWDVATHDVEENVKSQVAGMHEAVAEARKAIANPAAAQGKGECDPAAIRRAAIEEVPLLAAIRWGIMGYFVKRDDLDASKWNILRLWKMVDKIDDPHPFVSQVNPMRLRATVNTLAEVEDWIRNRVAEKQDAALRALMAKEDGR